MLIWRFTYNIEKFDLEHFKLNIKGEQIWRFYLSAKISSAKCKTSSFGEHFLKVENFLSFQNSVNS